MKTILTIDFDIVMDNYIELYNNKETTPWERRFQMFPILQSMPINAYHYKKAMMIILNLISNLPADKIHFI